MNKPVYFSRLHVLVAALLLTLSLSCSLLPVNGKNHAPVIGQLNIDHPTLYPLGNTQVECFAVDQAGHDLEYTWTCTAGTITGNGSMMTWEAPAAYGDYYIMVTVDDGAGGAVNKIGTVSVIVRQPDKNCPLCPK